MYFTIYRITNLLDGKIYVGKHQTQDLDDGYMGSGKYIKRAIQKHGLENFKKEILFIFDNESDMNLKEAELVNEEYILAKDNYNLCLGGKGGFSYLNMVDETRHDRRSKAGKLGQQAIVEKYGKSLAALYADDASQRLTTLHAEGKIPYGKTKGYRHSDAAKRKIGDKNSLNQKGENNCQFGTMWITNGIESKKIKKGVDQMPDGWYKGRKMKTI